MMHELSAFEEEDFLTIDVVLIDTKSGVEIVNESDNTSFFFTYGTLMGFYMRPKTRFVLFCSKDDFLDKVYKIYVEDFQENSQVG